MLTAYLKFYNSVIQLNYPCQASQFLVISLRRESLSTSVILKQLQFQLYIRFILMNLLRKLQKWGTEAPQKIQQKIQKFKDRLSQTSNLITQIRPGLCHMPFPEPHLINPLSEFICKKFGSNFFIWNLGEQAYDTQLFHNQVSHTNIKNYPVFPLNNLLLVAVNIKNWLKQEGNVALLHCSKNKGRSSLVLAIYLYLDGWHQYLQDAIVEVNKLLSINKNQTIFPSQHVFVRNCINLFNGFKINKKRLRLVRVLINKLPQLAESDSSNIKFSPQLDVYHPNQHIYTTNLFQVQNQSLAINLSIDVVDDVLISIKHTNGQNDLYPCFRIILNTNFVTQNFIRISQNELDLTRNIKPMKGLWIDFFFETVQNGVGSKLFQVWEQAQKVFKLKTEEKKPLRKIEEQHLQKTLQVIGQPKSSTDQDTSFAIDEVSPLSCVVSKPVEKQVQKIVMQDDVGQEQDDIDDYIKELQQSIDMS